MSDAPPDQSDGRPRRFGPEQHVVPDDWRQRAERVMKPFVTPQVALAWIYLRDDEALSGVEQLNHGRFTVVMAREKARRPTYLASLDETEDALLHACQEEGGLRAFAAIGDQVAREHHKEIPRDVWSKLALIPLNETYVAGPAPGKTAPNYHDLVFDRDQVLNTWPPSLRPTIHVPAPPIEPNEAQEAETKSDHKILPALHAKIIAIANNIWPDGDLPARKTDRNRQLDEVFRKNGQTPPGARTYRRAFADKSGQ